MYSRRQLIPLTLLLLTIPSFAQEPPGEGPAEPTFLERLALLAGESDATGTEDAVETPQPDAIQREANQRFGDLQDLYYQHVLEIRPELATLLGEPVAQERWSDVSLAAIRQREDETAAVLELLRSLDPADLDPADRLDWELLRRSLERQTAEDAFLAEFLPLSTVHGLHHDVPRTLAAMPRRKVAHYERILARIAALPDLVDQTLVLLRLGLDRGVTPPRATLGSVPRQIMSLIPETPHESPLLASFRSYPHTIPLEEQKRLRQAAEATYRLRARPAFEKLHRYLTVTYLPGARTSISLADLPDGAAWYAHRARWATRPGMTPQEIHDLGLAEVERLRGEMDEVIAETEFRGDFAAFGELLRSHPQFHFDDSGALLRSLRDLAKRADGELPRFVGHLPRLPYGVEPMARGASTRGFLHYEPGSMAAGRAARLRCDLADPASRPRWMLDALILREAVPGRHLATALARENEALPWYRRFGDQPAFVEGWTLYAESLGAEMGFYADPYARFGKLESELWHALWLVADTGIHALGWSRQRAIEYLSENTARPRRDVVEAVDRALVEAGRALAAKIGALEIARLRRRAEEAHGEKFDPRAFHDAVLKAGPLPLDALARRIERWIEHHGE